ncbi:hypothetical protein PJFCHJHM_00174 [Salmonella phage EH4]|nr:hypothetical protein PJFCHJHM_00174 [Salmonella phage EH4]
MKFGKSHYSAKNACQQVYHPIHSCETSDDLPEIRPPTPARTPPVSPQTSALFPKAPAEYPQHIHDAC